MHILFNLKSILHLVICRYWYGTHFWNRNSGCLCCSFI